MENLLIEGTDTLPSVEMQANGNVKLKGRALPEDAVRFFQPIHAWIKEFHGNDILIDINLEYFNTSVSKQLHNFFILLNHKPQNCTIAVVWNYEEGDDEMQESGEIYKELFPRFKFSFKRFEEILE